MGSQRRAYRPGHGTVVAYLALFIALGGTSYGLATGSIGSREIKNSSIRSKDIRNNQVRSGDVRNRSLLARDFKAGQLPTGQRGPQGPRGPEGPPGIGDTVQEIGYSDNDASDRKIAFAECPEGTVSLGGGYGFLGAAVDEVNIAVTHSDDFSGFGGPEGGGWQVVAVESAPVTDPWQMRATVICG